MKPFLHGKKSLAQPALHLPSFMGAHSPRKRSMGPELVEMGPVPTIEVVREGDKVARLIVTCSCGQKVEVDCIYPAGT